MNHSDCYFQNLNAQLKAQHRAIPCLLLDLDILDQNLDTLKTQLNPQAHLRIVDKSLPSFELIDYIMKKTNTQKIMCFHQPFLTDLATQLDHNADLLLGKPMPIKTARYFYDNLPNLPNQFNPFLQIQWLVDTEKRIIEYINLAAHLNQKIKLNIEIDVGLHRGGFDNIQALRRALHIINANSDKVQFSGLMGYDPHIVKIPAFLRHPKTALQESNRFYAQCQSLVKREFPNLWNTQLTFNGAGSPTFNLHNNDQSPLNDISIGSCLVKPTTFDIPTLKDYQAACFIATPILKKQKNTTIPGIEKFKNILNFINSKNKQSFFIYGGFWQADYHYPKGITQNALFGTSTNQAMLNTATNISLDVDDFVFLRPHQSEFVFLQFGEIITIRNGKLSERWPLLKNN